jgi:hypothetical protein
MGGDLVSRFQMRLLFGKHDPGADETLPARAADAMDLRLRKERRTHGPRCLANGRGIEESRGVGDMKTGRFRGEVVGHEPVATGSGPPGFTSGKSMTVRATLLT